MCWLTDSDTDPVSVSVSVSDCCSVAAAGGASAGASSSSGFVLRRWAVGVFGGGSVVGSGCGAAVCLADGSGVGVGTGSGVGVDGRDGRPLSGAFSGLHDGWLSAGESDEPVSYEGPYAQGVHDADVSVGGSSDSEAGWE